MIDCGLLFFTVTTKILCFVFLMDSTAFEAVSFFNLNVNYLLLVRLQTVFDRTEIER